MVKASLTLSTGTTVTIEGSPEEVRQLIRLYEDGVSDTPQKNGPAESKSLNRSSSEIKIEAQVQDTKKVEIAGIIALIRDCDEAEVIEKKVLDQSSQLNRTILPLYILEKNFPAHAGLTSGEISKVTKDLGVPLSTANVAHTLVGAAARYVIADKARKKG
jgi:ABC-type transporter Mla MlaB component